MRVSRSAEFVDSCASLATSAGLCAEKLQHVRWERPALEPAEDDNCRLTEVFCGAGGALLAREDVPHQRELHRLRRRVYATPSVLQGSSQSRKKHDLHTPRSILGERTEKQVAELVYLHRVFSVEKGLTGVASRRFSRKAVRGRGASLSGPAEAVRASGRSRPSHTCLPSLRSELKK